MLMNLATGDWDDELLRDLRRAARRCCRRSWRRRGSAASTRGGASGEPRSRSRESRAISRRRCSGRRVSRPGLSKNTYGTGCFALMHTGGHAPVSKNRLLATRAASPDGSAQFAVEGSVFIAGAAVQWLRDKMQIISTAAESEAVAARCPDTGGALLRAGVRRAGRAALGFGRARHFYGHHRGYGSRAAGAGGARKHRLSDARTGGGDGIRQRRTS